MHHTDTLELAILDLQCRELLLESRDQLSAVYVFAGTLEIISMGAEYEN